MTTTDTTHGTRLEHGTDGTDGTEADTAPRGPATRVVMVSLAAGATLAVVLTMVLLPGAPEGVTAGATLIAFGLGWTLLFALSRRTRRPQRWAALPGAVMTSTGLVLVTTAPSDHAMHVLTWVWPPLALALAGWTHVRMRRSLTGPGRWLVTTTLVLLGAVSVAAGARQATTQPFAEANPAPGTTIAVNGHDLHLDCRGQGSPTVVLFNGLGEFSASWARIVDGTSPTTRVCAYDRPGQGWSDDLDGPQDAVTAAADLHALLAAAGEHGPFVLTGHSIGGPYALTYADQYPDDVAGMVLLDSTSPHQFTVIPSYPRDYANMRRLYGVAPTLARIGVGALLTGSHLPADDARPVDAWSADPRSARNARDDVAMLPEVFRQAQHLTTFGDRPLVVLTSADTADDTGGWTQAQRDLADLSGNAVRRVVDASHAGMVEDPAGAAASVQAITSVVDAVRDRTPLAAP